ncbi:hypothetical protein [Luteipulveratus halotolerans]|uniref:Uncharacterized protein n=1 Tax=Luteipulveratus halotolerans TaxID=1631356 RepID=A0A0L6CLD8_9MICO|nr:hypothetical protein [Luteipulveratus halotolerans]KNX38582.1 hypothetical protein VV01_17835 [Luteipulveratus halotolerans]
MLLRHPDRLLAGVREVLEPVLMPLADEPVVQRLLREVSAGRDRFIRAQEGVLGALNLPTATDVARLERRMRAPADALDRLDEQLERVEARLRRIEGAVTHEPTTSTAQE